MYTEECKLTKDGLINPDNGKILFVVESIKKKNIPAPEINAAYGKCRKTRGKKLFTFCIKKDGLVLVTVT